MKINNIEITKSDFESLLNTIKNSIKSIDEGKVEDARFILEAIEAHLEHNLQADRQVDTKRIDKAIKLHDRVRIVSSDDYETNKFVGKEGYIIDIDDRHEYPYEIELEDWILREEGKSYLWRAEDLELV